MINLGRVIDNAVDLVESLLATDFTADYLQAAPPAPRASTATPAPRPDPAEPRHRTATATPSRAGAAVQAARATCEKLSCALVATEAARLSTHIANLKLTSTPPQLQCSPGPLQQQQPSVAGSGRCGNLTSRELRFCVEASPVRNSACFPLSTASGASLMAVASPGFATARGPRRTPLPGLGTAGLSPAGAASTPAAASAEQSSPLRLAVTVGAPRAIGVPALALQGGGAAQRPPPPPPPQEQHHQQQQQQQQVVALALPQQQQQQARPVALAGAGASPVMARLSIWLPRRLQTASADGATSSGSPADWPMPLGSPLSPSSSQPTPVLITSSSPSPPFGRRLGGPAPAVQAPPLARVRSPAKAVAAAATGVTPPCEPGKGMPPRTGAANEKPATAAVTPGKGMPPRPLSAFVPSLRLPVRDEVTGSEAAAAGWVLSSRLSRDGVFADGRAVCEDGASLGGSGRGPEAATGLDWGPMEERGRNGEWPATAAARPQVPGLRLGAIER